MRGPRETLRALLEDSGILAAIGDPVSGLGPLYRLTHPEGVAPGREAPGPLCVVRVPAASLHRAYRLIGAWGYLALVGPAYTGGYREPAPVLEPRSRLSPWGDY